MLHITVHLNMSFAFIYCHVNSLTTHTWLEVTGRMSLPSGPDLVCIH